MKIISFFRFLNAARQPKYLKLMLNQYNKDKVPVYKFKKISIASILPGLSETIDYCQFGDGSSYPIDIALYKGLIKRYNKKRFLEIGTFKGGVAENLGQICKGVSIDCKEWENRTINNNVEYLMLNSKDISDKLGKFDFIFIDGNHTFEYVKNDTEKAFQLLEKDGIIVWHDYLKRGLIKEVNPPVSAGIMLGCPPDKQKYLYCVPETLCAVYIEREFKEAKSRVTCELKVENE
jgi:predicted O-methyltransferase YrrM